VNVIDSLINYRDEILNAIGLTLSAGLGAILIATVIGTAAGTVLTYGYALTAWPIRIYVDIIRGIPGLVVIFVTYYLLGFALQSVGVTLSAWAAGLIALSIVGIADVAEITRGAFQSIPRGQVEAGKAIGLRFRDILTSVLLPQAVVQMIPPWTNTATELIKGTTLLSLIGVTELLLTANQLVARGGNALYFFIAIGILFLIINTLIQLAARAAEKKLDYRNA
jgi:polar amino acid transport system permease protein